MRCDALVPCYFRLEINRIFKDDSKCHHRQAALIRLVLRDDLTGQRHRRIQQSNTPGR
jgi:hypothetical protein